MSLTSYQLLLPRNISYITTSATSWKPPLTRCLKESDCGLILLSYGNIVVTEGLEPPTGGDPIRLMRPTLHLRHNICGEGMESNHRHKGFQPFALPTELPHHIWGWEPLCCLKSDTHLLSDSLLGQITFPFSREQHNFLRLSSSVLVLITRDGLWLRSTAL